MKIKLQMETLSEVHHVNLQLKVEITVVRCNSEFHIFTFQIL